MSIPYNFCEGVIDMDLCKGECSKCDAWNSALGKAELEYDAQRGH